MLVLAIAPVALIALAGAGTGVWVALAVGGLVWLRGFATLLLALRRERS